MFKPVIYVICDKCECYAIPQLNCKFESVAVSLQRMTLFVNFQKKIVEKNIFTLKI